MKVKRYKKLPIPVNAIQYTGTDENIEFILNWSNKHSDSPVYTPITVDRFGDLAIETLEGTMCPMIGDYVVQGPEGECWFVNKDIFEKTYEEIND